MIVQIKRYANRKLYNTETSRYITLAGISELLREGREIRVLDNETGSDISALVLSRVLVDTERKTPTSAGSDPSPSESDADGSVIAEVMQRQLASLFTLLRRYVEDVQGNLNGVAVNVAKWMHAEPEPPVNPEGLLEASRSSTQSTPITPDLEVAIRSAVLDAIQSLDLPTRGDLERLRERLDDLESSLQKLHSRP